MGLHALAINWGPWAEVGMAGNLEHLGDLGVMSPKEALHALGYSIQSRLPQMVVVDFIKEKFKNQKTGVVQEKTKTTTLTRHKLLLSSPENRLKDIKALVRESLYKILGYSDSDEIDENQGFFDLGVDSVSIMEITSLLQEKIGDEHNLLSTIPFDYSNINSLSKKIEEILFLGIVLLSLSLIV
jgi:acyl carrier protein